MTTTDAEGNEIILEPGDEGYVAPEDKANEPQTHNEELDNDVIAPGPNETMSPPAEPAEDLTHVQQPGESDADFAARTRGVVVDSQSPADIVPNTPQTTMGVRIQVEGTDPPVYVGVPPETILEETEGEGEVTVENVDPNQDETSEPVESEATPQPSSPQQGEPITADEPVVITPAEEKKT